MTRLDGRTKALTPVSAPDRGADSSAIEHSHGKKSGSLKGFFLLLILFASALAFSIYMFGERLGLENQQGVRNINAGTIERELPTAPVEPTPTPEPKAEEKAPPAEAEEEEPEEENREPEPIELAMQQPPGSLRGWILTENGEYPAGVEVRLEFENLVKDGKKGPKLEIETAELGGFEFPEVPPGSWSIIAEFPGYAAGTLAGVKIRSGELTDSIEIVLPPALKLTGSVRTTTGIKLEGARVVLAKKTLSIGASDGELVRREINYREVKTDSKGQFTMEQVAPGNHAILVDMEGFASERQEFTMEREGKNTVAVELSPAASIGGLVRSVKSLPIADAEIEVTDPLDKNVKVTTKSKVDGSFVVSGLRASRIYKLTAKAKSFAPAGPFDIAAGIMENIIILESGGAISGKVTNLNSGRPEPDLALMLESASAGFNMRLAGKTASDGTYAFRDLPSGTYNVRVQSDDLTSEPKLGVKVKIPEETKNIDFSVYPGKSISGFVAEGETGYRINGATVSIQSRVGPEFLTTQKSSVVTDEAGSFQARNLPYGMYHLQATAEGYLKYPGPEAQAEVRLLPDEVNEPVTLLLSPGGTITGIVLDTAGSPVEGAVVQLFNTPGARARIDTKKFKAVTGTGGDFEINGIPLDNEVNVTASASISGIVIPNDEQKDTAPKSGMQGRAKGKSDPVVLTSFLSRADIIIRLGQGAPITVRVQDENGIGLSDANVSLSHTAFPGDPAPPDWSAQTSPLGNTTFRAIPEGRVSISASKGGYIGGGKSINVADGVAQEVVIDLERGTFIEGYVYDDAGLPVQDGHVDASAESGARGGGRGNIDNRGHFRINGVSEGSFRLNAYATRQTPTGKHTVRRMVTGAETNSDAIITVPMNGRLDGIVLDAETAEPIPSARVQLRGSYVFHGSSKTGFGSTANTQNPAGEFTFQNIPPAVYSLTITASNYLPQTVEELEVESPGTFWAGEILLRKGSSLVGKVISAEDGQPVIGASINLIPDGPGGKSGGKGEFKISSITPGNYHVVVDHGDYLPKTVNLVQIPKDGEADAGIIELEAGGKLHGKVTDGFGKPVIGAVVTVRYASEEATRVARTDGGGQMRMQGLKPGALLISITANFKRGKVTKTIERTITSNEEARFDIVLAGELTLQGSIVGPNGNWLTAPQVYLYPLEGDDKPVVNGKVKAEINGSYYRAEDLVEGRYLITVNGNVGGQTFYWHETFNLAYPGGNLTLRAPSSRIQGRVYNPTTGQPRQGMNVRLRGLSFPQSNVHALRKWWEWTASTDESGYYQFPNISRGTYEFVVTEPSSTNSSMEIIGPLLRDQALNHDVIWE